jgi:hypothetical protein
MKKNRVYILLFFLFGVLVSATQVQAGQTAFHFGVPTGPSEIAWGSTGTFTIPITCDNAGTDCQCDTCVASSGTCSVGRVPSGTTSSFNLLLSVPSNNRQGVISNAATVTCHDNYIFGSDPKTASITVTANYPTASQWSTYQAKQSAESAQYSANIAINSANNAIYVTAQNRINEASTIGADVSSATQFLNSAISDYNSASNLYASGNTAYNRGEYSSATSYYTQAQQKADNAQSTAANAKSMVDKIIEEYNQKKTAAQNQVTGANSAMDTAKQAIDKGDKVISDATVIGLDTAQAKADIATARLKIDSANAYYKEASNLFDQGNFDGAKERAASATTLANEANTLATSAYNTLFNKLTIAGESSKAILNANSEISQMNEIISKIEYIIRSTEKLGVNLNSTIKVIDDAKLNIDSAEDFLSQAKNRQSSGSFTESVNYANQARDKVQSAQNRLDTITQSFSLSTQNSLDKAYAELENKVAQAQEEVQSAQSTYGATPELVVNAQNDLSSAKNALNKAKSQIVETKAASDFKTLVQKAEAAFQSLNTVSEKMESASDNAKSAKMGLTQKIAAGAAVVVAAAGGGFLYYRSRKKKKSQKKSAAKEDKCSKCGSTKTKTFWDLEDGSVLCDKCHKKYEETCLKCGAKLKKNQKFCAKCGEKRRD